MSNENGAVCGAYLFHNRETGKGYVGSSGNVDYRETQHRQQLASKKHPNRKLQHAYDQNPQFDFVVVPTEDRDAAYDLEQAILDSHWGDRLLLNLSSDARAGNHGWSAESREKMRQHRLGTKHSPETRAKMSASRMGRVCSPDTREKLRQQVISEEHRLKLKEVMQGNKNGLGAKHPAESVARRAAIFSNPVMVDGVSFPSHQAAADHFGVTVTTVTNRIASPNPLFSGWKK